MASTMHGKIFKKSYKKSALTWNEKYELPDRSYSVQDYFEYIIKKYEILFDNPPIKTYINKIENRITFKIKTMYYLQLLTPETIKLLRRIKGKITRNKNGENVPHLGFTEVKLVHCNIVNNDYQHDLRVLYIFVSNKFFGQISQQKVLHC